MFIILVSNMLNLINLGKKPANVYDVSLKYI